ncbi:MAG: flagellar basal body rod protein FlgC [Myxococcales bacterium 68-20]|mgnify:FL=1|nr:flagellar basal body rod protein FlgC [Myxococcales bacterium]OJY30680.1 MAG: flagellar basal body rod protein FlgC [Myxococcales bacterium 68-20]
MKTAPVRPGVFSAMEVAASGLSAERSRMNVVAGNLANARTTRTAEGGPYRRLDPVFEAKPLAPRSFDPVLRKVETVELAAVRPDTTPGALVYEPGHPDANADGYVEYPNVNVVTEMVNMMTASRAYEAGVTSIESLKAMARAALRIGK